MPKIAPHRQYRQCRLVKTESGTTTETTSWLSVRFAQVGRVVGLKNDDDEWVEGWVVKQVSEPEPEPPDSRAAIRAHRNRTGDSAPKRRAS